MSTLYTVQQVKFKKKKNQYRPATELFADQEGIAVLLW